MSPLWLRRGREELSYGVGFSWIMVQEKRRRAAAVKKAEPALTRF